jgi:hypothetical protein
VCHTIQLCWDNRNPQDQSTSCSIGHPGRDYPETILQPNFGHPNQKQSRAQRVSRDLTVSVYLLRSEGIMTLTSDAYHWEQRRYRDCLICKIYCQINAPLRTPRRGHRWRVHQRFPTETGTSGTVQSSISSSTHFDANGRYCDQTQWRHILN